MKGGYTDMNINALFFIMKYLQNPTIVEASVFYYEHQYQIINIQRFGKGTV